MTVCYSGIILWKPREVRRIEVDVKAISAISIFFLLGLVSMTAANGLELGQVAPDFELKDSQGKAYRLSDFRGKKTVVLEFIRSGSW